VPSIERIRAHRVAFWALFVVIAIKLDQCSGAGHPLSLRTRAPIAVALLAD
jgi:hypothetical protein